MINNVLFSFFYFIQHCFFSSICCNPFNLLFANTIGPPLIIRSQRTEQIYPSQISFDVVDKRFLFFIRQFALYVSNCTDTQLSPKLSRLNSNLHKRLYFKHIFIMITSYLVYLHNSSTTTLPTLIFLQIARCADEGRMDCRLKTIGGFRNILRSDQNVA